DPQSFDTVPLSPPSAVFVVPGVEVGPQLTSRIEVANPRNQTAAVTLDLHDNSGALVDTATREIAPKGSLSADLSQLFPRVPDALQGYVTLTSTLPVNAAKRTQQTAGGTALPAVPLTTLQGAAGVLRSPQLIFDGANDTSLRLVN